MLVAVVIFAWLPLRLTWAFEDLRHYGDDPAALDTAVVWLAAATAALYVGVTALLWLRIDQVGTSARIAAVPAVLCAAYTLYQAAAHNSKIGFESGSLAFLGAVCLLIAVAAALRLPRLDLTE